MVGSSPPTRPPRSAATGSPLGRPAPPRARRGGPGSAREPATVRAEVAAGREYAHLRSEPTAATARRLPKRPLEATRPGRRPLMRMLSTPPYRTGGAPQRRPTPATARPRQTAGLAGGTAPARPRATIAPPDARATAA